VKNPLGNNRANHEWSTTKRTRRLKTTRSNLKSGFLQDEPSIFKRNKKRRRHSTLCRPVFLNRRALASVILGPSRIRKEFTGPQSDKV
jgi:hypothetical protein